MSMKFGLLPLCLLFGLLKASTVTETLIMSEPDRAYRGDSSKTVAKFPRSRNTSVQSAFKATPSKLVMAVCIAALVAGYYLSDYLFPRTQEELQKNVIVHLEKTKTSLFEAMHEKYRQAVGISISQTIYLIGSSVGIYVFIKVADLFNRAWSRTLLVHTQVSFMWFDGFIGSLLYILCIYMPSQLTDHADWQCALQSAFFLADLFLCVCALGILVRKFAENGFSNFREIALSLNAALMFALPIILSFLGFYYAFMVIFFTSVMIISFGFFYANHSSEGDMADF